MTRPIGDLITAPYAANIGPNHGTMRPTGLGSGFCKDNADFGIYCGEWCVGRIYENRSGPAAGRG